MPKLLLGRRNPTNAWSLKSFASTDQDQRREIAKANTKDDTQLAKEWQRRRADLVTLQQNDHQSLQHTAENALIRESNYAPLPTNLRQQLEWVFPWQNTAGLATWLQLREFAISLKDPKLPPAKVRTFQLEYARRWRQYRAGQQATAANRGQKIQEQFEVGGDSAAQQQSQHQDSQLTKQDIIQSGRQLPFLDDFEVHDPEFDPISPPSTDVLAGLEIIQNTLALDIGYKRITPNPHYPDLPLSHPDLSFSLPDDLIGNEVRRIMAATWKSQQHSNGKMDARQDGADTAAVEPQADLSLIRTIDCHSSVHRVEFSPDGRYLATSNDNDVQIFDSATGSQICEFRSGSHIRCMCYAPNSTDLAIGAQDGSINVWNIETCQVKFEFSIGTTVTSLVYPLDCDYIASALNDGSVMVVQVRDGLPVRRFEALYDLTTCNNLYALTSIAVSSGSRYIAAACVDDYEVAIWNYTTHQSIRRTPASSRHLSGVKQVVFSPSGTGLASCGTDGTIKIWSIGTHTSQQPGVMQYACVKTLGRAGVSENYHVDCMIVWLTSCSFL